MKNPFGSISLDHPTRIALTMLVISLVCSALIGITIILVGDFDETGMRVLATAGSIAGFSIMSFPSLFHLERNRYTYLTWMGTPSSLAFLVMIMITIWAVGDIPWEEEFLRIMGSAGVVAFATNPALLVLMTIPTNILISICRWVTNSVIAIVGFHILINIWTELETFNRLFAALIILDVLGTISVPILARMSRHRMGYLKGAS